MQAAKDAAGRATVIVLDEADVDAPGCVFLGVPGFDEEASIIAVNIGLGDQDLREIGGREFQGGVLLAVSIARIGRRNRSRRFVRSCIRSAEETRDRRIAKVVRESDAT